ncbi:MAG: hypothetical protein JW934_02500 [Anaerolineae bacterium]|nr:hypothetical protein [Anaerolineae bacterium]
MATEQTHWDNALALARQIDAEIVALPIQNTPAIRAIRRRHSTALAPGRGRMRETWRERCGRRRRRIRPPTTAGWPTS